MAKSNASAAKAKPKAKAKSGGSSAKGKGKAKAGAPEAPAVARQPGVERRKNHPMRAKNGYMFVLLTRRVEFVGQAGELVKVKPGFARNYLLPQGMATFATPHNLRIVEKHRERLRQLEEAKRSELRNLGAQISQRTIMIEAHANPEGHLYGSVNADQIVAALQAMGLTIEAEMVKLEGALKETGLYTIGIHLGQEIETEVKLWVVPTHTEEPTA